MSFQAMTWAAAQIAGGPSAKATLWAIANLANQDDVAWPSQQLIAEQSEQSVDSVQRRLGALEEAGILRRVPMKYDGRKTVDFLILARSRFYAAPLVEIEPLLPRGFIVDPRYKDAIGEPLLVGDGGGHATAICGNVEEPALPQTLPQSAANATALVRQQEPVTEPEEPLRERAGEGAQGRVPNPPEQAERSEAVANGGRESPKAEDDPKFQELLKRYPAVNSTSRCFPLWLRLDAEGRRRALARLEATIAAERRSGRTHMRSLETYLRDRLFDQVDEPADGKAVSTLAPARSREWWALVWRALAEGKIPKFFWEQARQSGTGWGVPVVDLPDESARAVLVGIECGSPEFEAWTRHLAGLGLRMAADEPHLCGKWIYVPSEWPPGMAPEVGEAAMADSEEWR